MCVMLFVQHYFFHCVPLASVFPQVSYTTKIFMMTVYSSKSLFMPNQCCRFYVKCFVTRNNNKNKKINKISDSKDLQYQN